MATPYSLVRVEATASTQDDARAAFAGEPFVVVAERQSDGRGRGGSTWETAPRAMAASLAFTPRWPSSRWPVIPLVAGLAIAEVLDVELKWPNDVVRTDDKLGGILVEGTSDTVVVGIGLNLWWPEPPPGYGAVFPADPGPVRGSQIAESWTIEFLRLMDRSPDGWARDRYRSRCSTIGRHVAWEPEGAGMAVDIDTWGGLVVHTESGRRVLTSGAVRHVRPYPGEGV